VFDPIGRFLVYDSVQFALSTKPSFTNTAITLGSYYGTYLSYTAMPYVATSLYGYATVAGIMTLLNVAKFLDRSQGIVRIYLLSNCHTVRVENGFGRTMDVPLSAISLQATAGKAGLLRISINSKNHQLKLKQATYFDPVLLYAITNPAVSQVAASSYTA
jgi:hypothetical protein